VSGAGRVWGGGCSRRWSEYTVPSTCARSDCLQSAGFHGTQPVPAGATFADAHHITISDETPARPLIEHAIENKQEFVFVVVTNPRLESGAAIPAGTVQIDVAPKLTVGLPR